MGEMVEFASNGGSAAGYLAVPEGEQGRGVLVLQEWWGLVPQIKGVCDRLAGEGFTALAPDLYHGEIAEHTEMDKAGELMNSLPPDRAARDMGGAITYLLGHESTTGDDVGVIGFCMGGLLTMVIAAIEGDRVRAAVPFYGAPLDPAHAPDWSGLTATVRGHFAADDTLFPLDAVKELETKLKGMGKDVTFEVHQGVGHAFANEHNPIGTHDPEAADRAWTDAVAFLRTTLG
ncbi:MAG TPA: dienelactone hydrolase family protein [Acidimicrobiales bacterium]